MALFGNRERDELRSRLDAVEAELGKARKEAERALAKSGEAREAAKAAEAERDALKAKLAEAETARDRAREGMAKADQMGRWLEDKRAEAVAMAETARQGREDDTARAEEARAEAERARAESERLRGENDRLRVELEAARNRAEERARRKPAADAPVPTPAAAPSEDVGRLRAEVDDLRRRLFESEERSKVAFRKAEHNRRAWLVTQMQLDLAEDRLHLLTTGKPRPVLEDADTAPEDRPVAEEGEGYSYAADDIETPAEAAARAAPDDGSTAS